MTTKRSRSHQRITDRDLETLGDLEAANKHLTEVGVRKGWARPMDCGGTNGSHHSKTLQHLAVMGFVDMNRPPRPATNSRPGIYYKVNEKGAARLFAWRAKRKATT